MTSADVNPLLSFLYPMGQNRQFAASYVQLYVRSKTVFPLGLAKSAVGLPSIFDVSHTMQGRRPYSSIFRPCRELTTLYFIFAFRFRLQSLEVTSF